MGKNKRATIKHVAKAAGVSTQTVSRVINNRPDVSPETREQIQKIIEDLGYRPSALARSLIQNRSFTLGVVTSGLRDYIGPSRTLHGITSKSGELNYSLLLEELPRFDSENIEPVLQNLIDHHVDGIVWAVPEVGNNRRWVDETVKDIPVPIVFLTMQLRTGLTTVSINNYSGGILATRHLLAQGYRKIGHVSGPLDWWEARQRKQAWHDTMANAGNMVTDRQCMEGDWTCAGGAAAFQKLRQSYPDMEAVFIGNDQMSLSVLQYAGRIGMNIPGELAVVGFDNLPESPYFTPALTTINQDQHELGCRAVQELANQIGAAHRNEKLEPLNILLPTELVVRKSSAKR
jgi:LacI family transcriptional regulator